jgi:hypothetical protein
MVGWTLGLLLTICAIATVGAALLVWTSALTLDQRIAGLGATFTVGAFMLAVLGAAVALLAYRLGLQRPRMVVHIATDNFEDGTVHVGLDRPDEAGERRIRRLPGYRRNTEGLVLRVAVENTSDWSARNVAVRVDFNGMRRVPHAHGWSIAAYHQAVQNEIVALQWEGGADYAIHGHWTREMPNLFLNDAVVEAPGEECSIVVDVVAEGFRQAWTYAVKWHTQTDMQGKAGGSISGFTSYPASGIPPMGIYAIPVVNRHQTRRVDIVVGPGYRWFWFDDLEPGQYHVLAYPEQYQIAGGFTIGARDSGLSDPIRDHTLVPVVVERGNVTEGIRITDWGDTFPPKPASALKRS